MLELSTAARFWDGRINTAFKRVFDTTPTEWMRGRAMSAARTRLSDVAIDHSVSLIAMDHGFEHLGQFSNYYRAAYREQTSLAAVSA